MFREIPTRGRPPLAGPTHFPIRSDKPHLSRVLAGRLSWNGAIRATEPRPNDHPGRRNGRRAGLIVVLNPHFVPSEYTSSCREADEQPTSNGRTRGLFHALYRGTTRSRKVAKGGVASSKTGLPTCARWGEALAARGVPHARTRGNKIEDTSAKNHTYVA